VETIIQIHTWHRPIFIQHLYYMQLRAAVPFILFRTSLSWYSISHIQWNSTKLQHIDSNNTEINLLGFEFQYELMVVDSISFFCTLNMPPYIKGLNITKITGMKHICSNIFLEDLHNHTIIPACIHTKKADCQMTAVLLRSHMMNCHTSLLYRKHTPLLQVHPTRMQSDHMDLEGCLPFFTSEHR
jgi:hypothetical protein